MVSRFDEGGEAVSTALPDGALLREPAFGRREPRGIDAAGADATLFFGVDKSRSLQHRQMFQKGGRSEEHTSELQSLMRSSYAVFCSKNKTTITLTQISTT